ncbi:hypothetical protein OIU76_016403 [Salix suchowensis]|nr:hypothetical protein OIU76_016403 [Salix suchowensis]KAJ6379746.1 hypothetical protein OIU76_016403 [Salix suchowensis]KAJ6379747.1 hypothetical protein OIU76_016403 [Salix suchowensis]
MVSRILHKLIEPVAVPETSIAASDVTSVMDETSKSELSNPVPLLDYSSLFGEEFQIPHDHWDSSILSVLDIGAVEEGILHVLYACASEPLLCRKLAESTSEFWSALPLVQALLPALRPSVSSLGDNFDDSFSPWKQTFVQQALSQIVATSSSTLYHPLLHACAGYLSSFSPSHAKAACILIDLCSSVLAPWMAQVIAKVDLAVELLEDLLGTIQGARHSLAQARAALKYIVLALSGHMDDILGKYKEVKHRILFLLEMLEPFIDPAIYAPKSTIAFGDVSFPFLEKQEQNCVTALNVIRTAVQKPAVLPSLEFEWRRGSVAPRLCCKECQDNYTLHFRSHHNRAHGSNGARDTTGGASSGIPFLSFRIHYPRQKNESQDLTAGKDCSRALTIFIPASVFGDLSFQRRREILQSLILCPMFLIIAQEHSMIVEQKTITWFLSDFFHNSCEPKISEELESNIFDDIASKQKDCNLSVEEIEDFSNDLENLIAKLNPNIELCWNLFHQLAKKLTITSAQCLMYSRCLSSIVLQVQNTQENESEKSSVFKPVDWFLVLWRIGLEALAEVIMKLQESHCWEVASLMLDCLLGVPCCFPLDNVINIICSVIKSFSCCAPKISWRLKSDKWFSMLFARGFHNLHESDGHLADLFVTLLGHPEPEQRFVVLQLLGRLVSQDMHGEAVLQSNTIIYKLYAICRSIITAFIGTYCWCLPDCQELKASWVVWKKNACEVLCRLRNEGDEAEENLKEVLSTISTKQVDPDFGSTRESILQVLANLTSVQSCFDMFSKKIDQEAMELEEAEMELEILQKEHAVQESSKDSKEDRNNPWITGDGYHPLKSNVSY